MLEMWSGPGEPVGFEVQAEHTSSFPENNVGEEPTSA